MPLKLGLQIVADTHWMGGVNYIINLSLALKRYANEHVSINLLIFNQWQIQNLPLYAGCFSAIDKIILVGEVDANTENLPLPSEKCANNLAELYRLVDFVYPCMFGFSQILRTGYPSAGWLTDFQHRYFPELFSEQELQFRGEQERLILSANQPVFFSSKTALADAQKFYPEYQPPMRVLHFYTFPDPEWYRTDVAATIAKYQLPEKYLICCNQFWVHKNHSTLLQALKLLNERGVKLNLVCTGDTHEYRVKDYFAQLQQFARELGIFAQVTFLGVIPRAEQIALLRGALAVVQPSRFEGWSTVVEDARLLGKTIFLADIGVHREQQPEYGIFFAATSADDLAKKIEDNLAHLSSAVDQERETRARELGEKRVAEMGEHFYNLIMAFNKPATTPAKIAANFGENNMKNKRLKFMHINRFYSGYFPRLHQLYIDANATTYQQQLEVIKQDGFGALHMYAFYMPPETWESQLVIFSGEVSQQQWWREYGNGECPNDPLQLLQRQIEIFQPDVLFIGGPIPPFDSTLLKTLAYKPKLICGWQAASIPNNTDWSAFDIIFSDAELLLALAPKHGAANAVFMHPNFPRWLAEKYQTITPDKDVIFAGSANFAQFTQRNQYWEQVAQAAITDKFNFSFHASNEPQLSAPLKAILQPQLWGGELYEAMKRHRIVLNAYSHIPNVDGFNMRLLEGIGCGCFVLNEYVSGIEKHFVLDQEIVCFRTADELVQKINYYLAHDDERQAIAKRGQAKVFANYNWEQHGKNFAEFMASALQQKAAALQTTTTTIPVAVDVYDQAYLWGWRQPHLQQLVYLCYKTPNFIENAQRFVSSPEFREELRLLAQLGKPARKDIKVLDFGCGNGIASYALARAGYTVTGMDSSLGEIAGIKAAQKLLGLDGAQFTINHSTAENIPFADETFDIVWMREALHHMHNLPQFVAGIRRVLKPNGVLCCWRDPVIWNETQRQDLYATHPFYHITQDEGCYYLQEYLDGFQQGGMELKILLDPVSSPINAYPSEYVAGRQFNSEQAKRRTTGYDLFTFLAVKPVSNATNNPQSNNTEKKPNTAADSGGQINSAAIGNFLNHILYRINKTEENILLTNGAVLTKQQLVQTTTNINDYEFKIFSQFGDDGIIQYLARNLNLENETFIEFGVQDYLESNTRFLLMNNNWSGFVMDGSAEAMTKLQQQEWFWRYNLTCKAVFIDRDNINALLAATQFKNLGLLHIDLDGNDYWIWESLDLSQLNPAIIIVEYNCVFGKERPISVPYDPRFYRTEKHYSNLYWGASIKAFEYLGEQRGYALIGCNRAGNNAYFVRKDLLNERVKPCRAEDAYYDSKFRESRDRNGNLSYLHGDERRRVIANMEVINVVTSGRELVGSQE